jgi:hypothetical protein
MALELSVIEAANAKRQTALKHNKMHDGDLIFVDEGKWQAEQVRRD